MYSRTKRFMIVLRTLNQEPLCPPFFVGIQIYIFISWNYIFYSQSIESFHAIKFLISRISFAFWNTMFHTHFVECFASLVLPKPYKGRRIHKCLPLSLSQVLAVLIHRHLLLEPHSEHILLLKGTV